MSSRELGPEWVLSAFLQNAEARGQDDVSELAIVACRLWPRIQAHARKELTNKTSDDTMVLATGVWESVLLIRRENHASVKWKRPANTEPGGLSLRSLSPSLSIAP
jgi:hypothetical protein